MAKMMLTQAIQWMVDTEDEAIDMINEYKDEQDAKGYVLAKSGYTLKQKKSKGEVVDEHYIVDIKMKFE